MLLRRVRGKRGDGLSYVFGIYGVGLMICAVGWMAYGPSTPSEATPVSRRLLEPGWFDPGSNAGYCDPPPVKIVKSEFPKDVFCEDGEELSDGCEGLKKGGILLHVWCIIVMFYGIALLCDNYFEPALERICEFLDLEDDVAGATFMAAGGSAPELATSLLGTFYTKSDIGIGTIIGSATFNILFVIAVCAFAAPNLKLTWWPLARDCCYYCISIMVLTGVIFDNKVTWWEALLLFGMYLTYVFIMSKNQKLHRWADNAIRVNDKKRTRGKCRDMVKSLMYDNNIMQVFIYAVIVLNLIGTVAQPFGDLKTDHYFDATVTSTDGGVVTFAEYEPGTSVNDYAGDAGNFLDVVTDTYGVTFNVGGPYRKATGFDARSNGAPAGLQRAAGCTDCSQHYYVLKNPNGAAEWALFDTQEHAQLIGQSGASTWDDVFVNKTQFACGQQDPAGSEATFFTYVEIFEAMDYVNLFCGIVYIVEFILKHYGTGAINYWRDPFDAFDGLLVFLVAIDMSISELNADIGSNARIARFARFFRVLRVLRVLRIYRSLIISKTDAATQTDPADISGPTGDQSGEHVLMANAHSLTQPAPVLAPGPTKVVPEEMLPEPTKETDIEKGEGGDVEKGEGGEGGEGGDGEEEDDDDGPFDPFEKPESLFGQFLWLTCMPLALMMYYTIPDCSRDDRAKHYPITFAMCISWIGALSYVMVWMCVTLGETAQIPETIMGLTLLAGGTSIPDALSSLAVARKGHGDMAVSSSVGSNIFDILVGLPIPWLMWTGCKELGRPEGEISIQSDNLTIMVGTLFIMVALVVTSIHICEWKLSVKLGYIYMGLYFLFILESILLES